MWTDVLQTLRDHRCQPRLLYTARLSVTEMKKEKTFHNKNKFKQYLSTNSALQKGLEGKVQPKQSNHNQENTRDK